MGAKASDSNEMDDKGGKNERAEACQSSLCGVGLSQGMSLPVPALRRLDEGLTEQVCKRSKPMRQEI